MTLAVDRHKDFVHIPGIAEVSTSALNVIGVLLTELKAPLANRLIEDHDTASGEDFFNIAIAQCKAKIYSHPVADDLGRIAIAGIRIGRCFHFETILETP